MKFTVGGSLTFTHSNLKGNDTDGDGYNDDVDPRPKIRDVFEYKLKQDDFVPVFGNGIPSYGGSQMWYTEKLPNQEGLWKNLADEIIDLVQYDFQVTGGFSPPSRLKERFTWMKCERKRYVTSLFSLQSWRR